MAITNLGPVINLDANLVPDSYTPPSITTFDPMYSRKMQVEINKSMVAHPDPAVTFGKIISAGFAGLTDSITTSITAHFNGTGNNVECYYEFNSLQSNVPANDSSDFFTDEATKYICDVIVRIRVS